MWQLAWWRMYQGPATENMAVLTTSSFCVYPDTLRPSLGLGQLFLTIIKSFANRQPQTGNLFLTKINLLHKRADLFLSDLSITKSFASYYDKNTSQTGSLLLRIRGCHAIGPLITDLAAVLTSYPHGHGIRHYCFPAKGKKKNYLSRKTILINS